MQIDRRNGRLLVTFFEVRYPTASSLDLSEQYRTFGKMISDGALTGSTVDLKLCNDVSCQQFYDLARYRCRPADRRDAHVTLQKWRMRTRRRQSGRDEPN